MLKTNCRSVWIRHPPDRTSEDEDFVIRICDRSITDSYNHWTDSTIDCCSTELQLIATDWKLVKLADFTMANNFNHDIIFGCWLFGFNLNYLTSLEKSSLPLIMNYKLDNIGVLNLAFQFSKCHFFLTIKK